MPQLFVQTMLCNPVPVKWLGLRPPEDLLFRRKWGEGVPIYMLYEAEPCLLKDPGRKTQAP